MEIRAAIDEAVWNGCRSPGGQAISGRIKARLILYVEYSYLGLFANTPPLNSRRTAVRSRFEPQCPQK